MDVGSSKKTFFCSQKYVLLIAFLYVYPPYVREYIKKNEMQGFNLSLTLKVRALNRKEIIKNNEEGNMDYIYLMFYFKNFYFSLIIGL